MAETLKIKDLPIDSRPREAFMRAADPVREIPDSMLLAILIRTGQKGSSAIDIANRLIKYFGSTEKLVEASWQQILNAKVCGVGKVAAVQLAAAFALVRRTVRMSHRAYSRSVAVPSEDDIEQTRRLVSTGRCVGIPLDDHIVVAGEKWMSMRNEELVDFNRRED